MSGYPSSTDPYRAVITDLRDELAAIDQRAASLRSMIEVLEAKAATRLPDGRELRPRHGRSGL